MTDKIFYIAIDNEKNILISKLDNHKKILELIKNKNEVLTFQNTKYRVGFCEKSEGTIYAYTSFKDFIKSSQKFNTYISVIGESITDIVDNKKNIKNILIKQINVLIHNLVSLNAHNLQEIHNLFSQETLNNSISNKKQVITNIVKGNPEKTASALLKLMKNNNAIKTEFSVFAKLFEDSPKLNMKNHNVHKVLMNLLYGFFPDFTDHHINVTVNPSTVKAYFDYESLYVAFFYLLDNATKYIQPHSSFEISFKDENEEVQVIFNMLSLKIHSDEKEKIFNEGYSGVMATKKDKQGMGIGMARAKKILELNSASIKVDCQTDYKVSSCDYQNNIFIITLKKESFFPKDIQGE